MGGCGWGRGGLGERMSVGKRLVRRYSLCDGFLGIKKMSVFSG